MEILLLDRITKHARAGYKHIYIYTTYNMLCSQICRLFIAVIVLSARAKLFLLFIIITIIFALKQNLFPTWARIIFSVWRTHGNQSKYINQLGHHSIDTLTCLPTRAFPLPLSLSRILLYLSSPCLSLYSSIPTTFYLFSIASLVWQRLFL